jgi:Ca-activated chloride channel family protein
VLVSEAGSTLVTVAKDVKLQVEFNPAVVAGYRLVGYENRVLANQDFNDDKKDAGEVGAGHAVTALYEIVPVGLPVPGANKVDDLKYQMTTGPTGNDNEMMTVKIRYKAPDGDTSKLLSRTVSASAGTAELTSTSVDFRWATAMAAFGMLLRESEYRGDLSWQQLQSIAEGAVGKDPDGYRKQALGLIEKASKLASSP